MSRASPVPGEIVRIRGERWGVVRSVSYGPASVLEVAGCDSGNRGVRASFLVPFEPVERLPARSHPRVVKPARWRHVARQALAESHDSPVSLRAAARAAVAVWPYQLEPALAVTSGLACRLLIADAVGLGKTVEACFIVAELLERNPDAHVMIATPAGLKHQWLDELRQRFAIHATVLDAAALAGTRSRGAWVNPWSAVPVVITSIDYVKRPEIMRSLEPLVWDAVILDEAHNLSGRSDRAAAANELARRARTVVMLSATPHSGDEKAFERLCGTGDLQNTFPLLTFRRTRHACSGGPPRRDLSLRITPTFAEEAMHRALLDYTALAWNQSGQDRPAIRLAMTVLARRSCSSPYALMRSAQRRVALLNGTEIQTAGVQQMLPFDRSGTPDEEPGAELAIPALADEGNEREWLERIADLSMVAAERESKIAALRRLLSRTREAAIVFTQYRDTLAHLAPRLGVEPVVQLHGGLTLRERHEAARRFNAGEARVLLATDAASEGLNLQSRCRLVINLELPWTPTRLEQRVGRVDRIGQRGRVHAVHLVAAGTSEEAVAARLEQRRANVHRAFGTPTNSGTLQEEMVAWEGGTDADLKIPVAAAADRAFDRAALTRGACQEAERIARSRYLTQPEGGDRTALTRNAALTIVRSRHSGSCYWAFRVDIVNGDGRLVWSAPIALAAAAHVGSGATPALARRLLNPAQAEVADALRAEESRRLEEALRCLAPPLELASHREHAIAEFLEASQGRLAAAVSQRGLFERRTDRLFDSYSAVLRDALGKCSARLDTLASMRVLSTGDRTLLFAVAIR